MTLAYIIIVPTLYCFAAGIITDEVTRKDVVIVTGGFSKPSSYLQSTEILLDDKWIQGKIIIQYGILQCTV